MVFEAGQLMRRGVGGGGGKTLFVDIAEQICFLYGKCITKQQDVFQLVSHGNFLHAIFRAKFSSGETDTPPPPHTHAHTLISRSAPVLILTTTGDICKYDLHLTDNENCSHTSQIMKITQYDNENCII